MLLLMVTACQKTPFQTDQVRRARVQEQARQLLHQGDYAGTMNLIQQEVAKGMDEKEFSSAYLKAARGSLAEADILMTDGHYAKAASLLQTVQKSYPQGPILQEQMAISPAQLQLKIDVCVEKLMEAGLLAYRSGELATAIKIWQQVFDVDPQHQAAQKAIQISRQQILKIKSLSATD